MNIWLDERIRLINSSELLPTYNIGKIFKIDSGHLSINQCLRALNCIVDKHWIFRTRLKFDVKCGILYQSIDQTIHYPVRVSTIKNDEQQKILLDKEMWTPFDTEHNGVFRCHFIRYDHGDNKDDLSIGDLLVFYFHHGSFDGRAIDIFLDEFKLAYKGVELQSPCLQYIDYSVHERKLAMTEARTYWHDLLQDYDWDRQLDLGQTKKQISACRSGRGELLRFSIPSSIAHSMIYYINQFNVTLFQLGLTCYYIFLNQLSYHNRDVCIGLIHLNRYRPEIVSMIGMFANILPCRIVNIDLDKLSFIELLYKVQKSFLQNIQHTYLPYEELINLHRKPSSYLQFPYLQTLFSVDTTIIDYTNMDNIMVTDTCSLSTYKRKEKDISIGYKFDLDFSFAYDKHAGSIDCVWAYMSDVFQLETIEQHANRFNQLLTQLFGSNHIEQLQIPLNEIIILDKNQTNNDNHVDKKHI
ncbi:unnamed protein product [Rotaria sp. Silwood1]|nr:unnamed protein product [Rotaria sp. Silwood1]